MLTSTSKTSWFEFTGILYPTESIPEVSASYHLNRSKESITVEIEGSKILIRFVATYDSFEDLYYEIVEFVQAFLAVGAIQSGLPLELIVNEWVETPLAPLGDDRISHPVKGRVFYKNLEMSSLPKDRFLLSLAEGIGWSEDIEKNPFLRRAILDFNYALQHPLNDIPIYLYRAIESVEVYFGGEGKLIQSLKLEPQVKLIKRLANDAKSGLHTRHAAETKKVKQPSPEEIMEAIEATKVILNAFHLQVWGKNI